MSHFAKIENGVVVNVIVAEQDFIDAIEGAWIQTSYNTREGVHVNGGIPLRKNYASIGYIYDAQRDAFIPPKPFNSWLLNEDSCTWYPPATMPEDGKRYRWNEAMLAWDEIPLEETI